MVKFVTINNTDYCNFLLFPLKGKEKIILKIVVCVKMEVWIKVEIDYGKINCVCKDGTKSIVCVEMEHNSTHHPYHNLDWDYPPMAILPEVNLTIIMD